MAEDAILAQDIFCCSLLGGWGFGGAAQAFLFAGENFIQLLNQLLKNERVLFVSDSLTKGVD
jgi:hypothetical protein